MAEETRYNMRMPIIGAQGTGKTTLAKKAADHYPKKVIVIIPDDYERAWHSYPIIEIKDMARMTTGKRRVIYDPDNDEFMQQIKNKFTNGLVVWDDSKTYFNSEKKILELEKMLIRSRQTNVDHYFMYHGFSAIPSKLWTYSTHIALFRTNDAFVRAKDRVFDYKTMVKRLEHVNREALKNPHYNEIYKLQ